MDALKRLPKIIIPGIFAAGVTLNWNQKHYMIQYPPTKDRIRGEYENKIRRDSPPEKIFELFATVVKDDTIYMTHYDLFKSICPYNYSTKQVSQEELEKFKSGSLSKFADVDEDGMISVYEYFMVVCLIQASRDQCKKFFRDKNLKEEIIDVDTMREFFSFIRKKSRVKLTVLDGMPDPRKVSMNQEQWNQIVQQTIQKMFKESPKGINMKDFLQMREQLLEDVLKFEFHTFPMDENEMISGNDFAQSLISFLDVNIAHQYLKLLENVEFDGKISFQDYYVFQKFIQENMGVLNRIIEEQGVITAQQLKAEIEKYQKQVGMSTNHSLIDIFIRILDINNNQKIEPSEFTGVVQQRAFYGSGEENSLSQPLKILTDLAQTWENQIQRIIGIIMQ